MAPQKPAHEIRLGRIRVTIWANQTDDHDLWFNVTLTRLYRDENTWKDAASFRRDDHPGRGQGSGHGVRLDLEPQSGSR